MEFFLCIKRLFGRVFTRSNMVKMFIIFTFGFVSRLFVNGYFNLSVFGDLLDPISLVYYACMSLFIVMVHEYVNIDSLPSFYSLFSNYFL